MNDKFTSTQAAYNQHAAQFVQQFEKSFKRIEHDKFLSLLPKAGYILDAGCGSARDAAYFVSKGFPTLGIDLSPELLAEAKKLHPEVPTQVMSLTDITLPKEEFDGIWCMATILHLERKDIPHVFRSFHQILKPNGHIYLQTKSGSGEGTEPAPFDPEVIRYFNYFSLAELTELLSAAGFEIIEGYDFNGKQRNEKSRDINWVSIFAKKLS